MCSSNAFLLRVRWSGDCTFLTASAAVWKRLLGRRGSAFWPGARRLVGACGTCVGSAKNARLRNRSVLRPGSIPFEGTSQIGEPDALGPARRTPGCATCRRPPRPRSCRRCRRRGPPRPPSRSSRLGRSGQPALPAAEPRPFYVPTYCIFTGSTRSGSYFQGEKN